MAAQLLPGFLVDDSVPDLLQGSLDGRAGEVRIAARQPILDRHKQVHGYEVLFWRAYQDSACMLEPGPAEQMPALDTSIGAGATLFGLEKLTGGRPAFVKCTSDALTEGWLHGLAPRRTVLEVLEAAEPAPSLIAACRKLKQLGFRLAIDDFIGMPGSRPLLELADYIKVDVTKMAAARHPQLNGLVVRLVAKGVETQEDYRSACAEGFELFQGFYFCRPETANRHSIPGNRLIHLEILEVLQKEPVDLHRLSQLVMCDASLTYGLLRLVNSPFCAMRQEVTSIQSALMLLGEEAARHVTMLAIASELNGDQPSELLRMAFERGRFCEQAAGLLGLQASEQYLIGMVSLFPAMLRIPVEELVRMLPLRESARDALLGKCNPDGVLLDFLVRQETGDWKGCDALIRSNGLPFYEVLRLRTDAGVWADAMFQSSS